ncbi:MAG: type III pantothenate kinase [Ignavibacteria bacterium]|nr:type III pantothenate kinase [Ignavibacteria bacterium]
MLLAIDIGNTHTVYGIYDGITLRADWRVTSFVHRTEDEVGSCLRQFLRDAGLDFASVTEIGISSVVPNLTDTYVSMARKYFKLVPTVIDSSLDLGIAIHYKDPTAVGADRICNAVAGFAKYGGPLIVIDFGTATTYDLVARNGDYLGGVIAPGVETSAADLHRRAAKLPKVEFHFPEEIIARDTVSSMQAGILYGAIDSMEGMIARLQEEMTRREGTVARVIATGGFSSFLAEHSKIIDRCEPSLVLEGIRLICEMQKQKPA